MKLINKLFGKSAEKPIKTYADFWDWFRKHERKFYKSIKKGRHIEEQFFDKLAPKLNELKEGFFFLSGMYDSHTAELIITPDGNVKNIVYTEELVAAAPELEHWKFTALKPAHDIKDIDIKIDGYSFNEQKLSFYSIDHASYPDEIEITVVYEDLTEENKNTITNGIYIFLDNYLGELNFVSHVDKVNIVSVAEAKKELIPINKLKDFIVWREKEFIEKYEEAPIHIEDDHFTVLEEKLEGGNTLIATINTELLQWDSKASHPWILVIEIKYTGKNIDGKPNKSTYERLHKIEHTFLKDIENHNGILFIGRQIANNIWELYFACNDFRKPSKIAFELQQVYKDKEEITYDIYKDKYWISFDQFDPLL